MNLFNSGQAWQAGRLGGRADRGETGRQSLQSAVGVGVGELPVEEPAEAAASAPYPCPVAQVQPVLGRVCAVVTGRDDDGAAAQGVSSCLSSSSKSSSSATPASSMSGLESSNANNSSFT